MRQIFYFFPMIRCRPIYSRELAQHPVALEPKITIKEVNCSKKSTDSGNYSIEHTKPKLSVIEK
uniref:Uncharacterized protein n=1 Tax=Rhizophora mucronata TaxID=61149 RepID=A0A2P2PS61_RHIMU